MLEHEPVQEKMADSKIASRDDDVEKIDKGVKNAFRWEWLQVEIDGSVLGEFIRKVKVPGKYLCEWCGDVNSYASRGLSALRSHVTTSKHLEKKRIRVQNYSLGFGEGMLEIWF